MSDQELKIQELFEEIEILKERLRDDKDLIDELVPRVQYAKEYFLESYEEISTLKVKIEKVKRAIESLPSRVYSAQFEPSVDLKNIIEKHFEGLL